MKKTGYKFGRTWDLVASILENHNHPVQQVMRMAKLFCITEPESADWGDFLERWDFWRENFRLPYPYTAIEDKNGLVILSQLRGNNYIEATASALGFHHGPNGQALDNFLGGNEAGLSNPVFYVHAIPSWNCADDMPLSEEFIAFRNSDEPSVIVVFGFSTFTKKCHPDGLETGGFPICVIHASKSRVFSYRSGEDINQSTSAVEGYNALTLMAIRQVIWINNPDRFVVEEKPTQATHRKGSIKRRSERPTYHSWTPIDINRVATSRGGSQSKADGEPKVRGHWRRGHYRTLRSERFASSGRQGDVILIRPMFVGNPEFQVERTHYRVLTGKNDVLVGKQQENHQKERPL